jgi:hypothetical protein
MNFESGFPLSHRDPMGTGCLVWKKLWRLGPIIGPDGDWEDEEAMGRTVPEDRVR